MRTTKALTGPGADRRRDEAQHAGQAGSGDFVTERIKQALTQTPDTIALLKQAAAAQ